MSTNSENKTTEDKQLTFFQITLSVMASMFGVQSDKNRIRDFQHGKPIHFITGGIIFLIIFLITVITVVKLAIVS